MMISLGEGSLTGGVFDRMGLCSIQRENNFRPEDAANTYFLMEQWRALIVGKQAQKKILNMRADTLFVQQSVICNLWGCK